MKKLMFLPLLLLLTAAMSNGQDFPVLAVEDSEETMKMTTLEIETVIYGDTAETSMTMTFANTSGRELAADLTFPLPEDGVISGYALDIEGQMVDGVIVEKDRGRQVYETIVRRGVDPGLAEQTAGNNFRTRIYPVPARGSRRVRVRYISGIHRENGTPRYILPLRFPGRLKEFSLRIEVVKPLSPPVLDRDSDSFGSFGPWRDSYVLEHRSSGIRLNENLKIALPDVEKQRVLLENAPDGRTYFAVHDLQTPPSAGHASAPQHITIYWDTSGSRTEEAVRTDLEVIEHFFGRLDGSEIRTDLIVFRNEPEEPRSFTVRNGNAGALLRHLASLPADGATRMGDLPLPDRDCDYCLFFSDGLANFGVTAPPEFPRPVYTFSSAAGTDASLLRYTALQSGGEHFNLLRISPEEAAGRIGAPLYRFLGAEVLTGSVETPYPTLNEQVDGLFRFYGILTTPSAEIVLRYGTGGRVMEERTVRLDSGKAVGGNRIRLLYGGRKLKELMMFRESKQQEIIDLGREFGLVTPGTSLIVLESPEQYAEFRIVPPASMPEWRRAYFELIDSQDKAEKDRTENKIEQILALWRERTAWWETEFKYPKGFTLPEDDGAEAESGSISPEPMASRSEAPVETMEEMAADESDAGFAGEGEKQAEEKPAGPSIEIAGWDPDTPYLTKLKDTPAEERYEAYLKEKEAFGGAPSFYLDCGDYFISQGQERLGLRIWSNIAELELENPALLRILAHRLFQEGKLEDSRMLFEQVLKLRPEEPQSRRDLALVLADLERYYEATRLLYEVITGEWDRFQEIELIALMEMNRIIARAGREGQPVFPVDRRFVKLLDTDVRIILTWDADLTDMDLWVTEPSGEKAYYGNRSTRIGGNFSRDFTQGYGPEEYLLKRAMKGDYKIEVNYYSSGAPSLAGTVTLQVDIFTDYGREDETKESVTIRLSESSEVLKVGTVRF